MRKTCILSIFVLLILSNASSARTFNFDEWYSNYYKQPSPHNFMKAVSFYLKEGHHKEKNQFSTSVFFGEIMAQNPSKIDSWVRQIRKLNYDQETFLQNCLWFSRADEADKYLTEDLKKLKIPIVYEIKPNNASILDMNWCYFFATGRKQPIRNIIRAFNYFEDGITIEEYKKTKKTETDKDNLKLGLSFEAAKWSLESNCSNHQLVLDICKNIYENEELNENESLWLGTILAKTAPDEYSMSFVDGGVRITKQKTSDYEILDNYIEELNLYIGGYPPKIDSDEQLKSIKGKLIKALKLGKILYKKNPEDADILSLLGKLYSMAHNLDIKEAAVKSEKYFKKALALNTNHFYATMGLANLYTNTNQNKLHEAEKLFLKAKKLSGSDTVIGADEGLMFTYIYMGNTEKALKYCELCLKAFPESKKYMDIKKGLESDIDFKEVK